MRIIFVNRYFHPDQSATSRMLTSLAFALAKEGWKVIAVASRHHHDRQDIVLPGFEVTGGVEIHRLAGTGFGRHALMGRAADYATFHLATAKWLSANARSNDICVVCTDPPLLSVTAAVPLMLRRAVLVNWVMDLFPEVATELGMLPRRSLVAKLGAVLRDWSCRRAALTVCPINAMAAFLEERRTPWERLSVVHHWSDGHEIFPVHPEENPLRREWGLSGKFVVGYSGNFGRAHEFDTLLDAAEMLREDDGIRFLLIGDGNKRSYVEREVQRRRLSNILLKPLQPKALLAESLCASDLHIVSLLPELEHCIVPSKYYGILAAGRPTCFIGDRAGEVARSIAQNRCGVAVEVGDYLALAQHICAFRDNSELHAAACLAARHIFETRYTLDHGLAHWRELIKMIRPHQLAAVVDAHNEGAT